MQRKPNTILKSILIPFLLVFIIIFLTHVGMQTQLMDRELDQFISKNLITQIQLIHNYFVDEEVKDPSKRLHLILSSYLQEILDEPQDIQKILSSKIGMMGDDLYLDHLAFYNLNGEMTAQVHLSSLSIPENTAEFQELIKLKKVTEEIYGIDKTDSGLVLKIIFPIKSIREGVIGYISAIRYLDNHFFETINRHTNLNLLIFREDQIIHSTIPMEHRQPLPKIQEKVFKKQSFIPSSTERFFIMGTEYHTASIPFQNLRGERVGAIMLISGIEEKKQSVKKIVLTLLWATLVGWVLLLFFGFLISKGITTPIEQLIEATHKISKGDFNTTVKIQSHNELIALSEALTTMAENLKRTLVSKNYFYEIINSINELLIIVTPNHSIEFMNQATERVLGYSKEDLIGKPFDLLFAGDYPLKGMEVEQIRRKRLGDQSPCVMKTKNGEKIPVSFSWSWVWDEKKQFTEIVVIARDIREQAKAELEVKEERDKLNTLINTTNDLIFIRNQLGEFTFVSHAVKKILGYTPEEFKILPVEKILSSNPLNHNFFESPKRWLKGDGKAEPYWVEFVTHDGKPFFIEINEALIRSKNNNEHFQIMGIGRDISERKVLEDQLRDFRESRMKKLNTNHQFGGIIGQTKIMQEIYELIKNLSQNDSTVLIRGESGTGKELIAQAIHLNSPRHNFHFIEVTCSVLSEYLLESELFGHVKGSFTGAIKDKPGRFEQAEGGSIFLDEIGDISLDAQIKLLRVLQEREVVRVGGEEKIKINVRIIAATNKNLEKGVVDGSFRQDLYYRLNVVPIFIPPLRERKEDIPLLVEHFIEKIGKKINKKITGVSQKAMNILFEYNWPGNIRQLENAVEYAIIRCRGSELKTRDFSAELQNAKLEKASIQDIMADTERIAIIEILNNCQWDMTVAAQNLNVSRTTLWRKMKKYEIKRLKNL